jgi:peptidoglycan/xylan/chitin deacetylase (PgdA/CDA1 family)
MNISLTLDYEIYFGASSGSAEHTLLAPTEALMKLAARHGVPLVLFVDVLWLQRLRELAGRHRALMAEHLRVCRQLEQAVKAGHELQLHLHPHWTDTHWDGERWIMDLRRYRLHAFDDAAIAQLTRTGAEALRALGGSARAFRAGGWCLQPFERLRQPLLDAGVCIDSTVYADGVQSGGPHDYDFRGAPAASRWRFDTDPLVPADDGAMLELPIASHTAGPALFWRMALARQLKLPRHRPLGRGAAVGPSRGDLLRKLFGRSHSVVSIDGLKADLLEPAWREARARAQQDFVVIGHPKAATRWSIEQLARFLHRHADERFVGLDSYLPLLAPERMRPAWYSTKASSERQPSARSNSSPPVSR